MAEQDLREKWGNKLTFHFCAGGEIVPHPAQYCSRCARGEGKDFHPLPEILLLRAKANALELLLDAEVKQCEKTLEDRRKKK